MRKKRRKRKKRRRRKRRIERWQTDRTGPLVASTSYGYGYG